MYLLQIIHSLIGCCFSCHHRGESYLKIHFCLMRREHLHALLRLIHVTYWNWMLPWIKDKACRNIFKMSWSICFLMGTVANIPSFIFPIKRSDKDLLTSYENRINSLNLNLKKKWNGKVVANAFRKRYRKN